MEHEKGVLAVSLAMLALSGQALSDDIDLYTFSAPPYQIVDHIPGPAARVHGLTVDTVLCAMSGAGGHARVHAAPQKRAIQFLVDNLIDGYFAADPSTSLDLLAFRTNPVSLEKWQLVSRQDSNASANTRIGAVGGSNEEAWLISQGKEILVTVRTPQQLVALLNRGRIDQALMDQRVLASLSDTHNLESRFLRYVPLHVYFSSHFVTRRPQFIDAFNRQIPACINGSFELDDDETGQIRAIAYDLFRELEALLPMAAAIEAGPEITNLSEILNLDAQWQALAPQHHSEMARRVADQAASITMSGWQKSHESLVTEIMLTNRIGTLVAMSRLTSDFWQGDEPKFDEHIQGDARAIFVSPIRYDGSTARFQVIVSMPVTTPGNWQPLGVLIIGLDVEKALIRENHIRYLTDRAN
jgi:ABC-type amino acid transport substrate-binding protein